MKKNYHVNICNRILFNLLLDGNGNLVGLLPRLYFFLVCHVLQYFLNKKDKIYIPSVNQTYSLSVIH